MKRHMSFQYKLVITYSVFVAVLMLFMGFSFFYYNSYLFEKDAYSRLNDLTVKMSQQLDSCIETMDYVSINLISQNELISSMYDLTYLDRNDAKFIQHFNKASRTINNMVVRTLVKKSEYTINIFNKEGDFYTNSKTVEGRDYIVTKIDSLEWVKVAREKEGDKYIVPPFNDTWIPENSRRVFSLVRMVRDPGYEIGFVEIQNSADTLTQICSVGFDKNIKVLVINNRNEIIYSNSALNGEQVKYYSGISTNGIIHKNPFTNSDEMINQAFSNFTKWTVFLIEDRESILKPLGLLKKITLLIAFALTAITFVFFFFFAKQLTKPLRKLKKTMEEVQIENLPNKMVVIHESNEIEALNRSFQDMKIRLNDAITHEFALRSMQMRAHYDSLQAQINPHFMHNMMNVLANMGQEAGAPEVSNTCIRISAMLRYSTSTDTRRTTIKDEIAHVENYLSLMKKRFEHKLEFYINIDKSMLEIEIPKIILQPLVENSISHGFENSSGKMEILINGYIIDGDWQIDIIDNGSGFSESILKDLENKIEDYSKQILNNEDSKGLSIGGMGLISTFARLRMFFGKEIKFILKNNETAGACISIGGSGIVQNNDSRG